MTPYSSRVVFLLSVAISSFGSRNWFVDASADTKEEELVKRCGEEKNLLPCDQRPPHLIGLRDPKGWLSAKGLENVHYRRTTAWERYVNGWEEGSYLVSSREMTKELAGGDRAAKLYIPLDDDSLHVIDFEINDRIDGLKFVERVQLPEDNGSRVESTLRSPTLFRYFNKGYTPKAPTNGSWSKIVSSNDGAIYATGLARGTSFEVDAPTNNNGWKLDTDLPNDPNDFVFNSAAIVKVQLLDLGTFGQSQFDACSQHAASEACEWLCTELYNSPCEDNTNIGPSTSNNCRDGFDNDSDGSTDLGDADCVAQFSDDFDWGDSIHPGSPKRYWESGISFALFGDGPFCTKYAANENGGGNWINRLTERGWATAAFLNQALGFVTSVSEGEKKFRYVAGGCWVFQSLEDAKTCASSGTGCPSQYPYSNAGTSAWSYYSNVWDDVHHGTYHGLDDAIHVAQVVYLGENGAFLTGLEGKWACGVAPLNDSPGLRGSSVALYNNYAFGCDMISNAHEIGHNCGLEHVDLDEMYSFMNEIGRHDPSLPPLQKAQLRECVSSAELPRPSGFRFNPW